MFGKSSNPGEWWSALEPAPDELFIGRKGDPEDPRFGEVVRCWQGGSCEVRPGQPVIIGFGCDEGVRLNYGRTGARGAPNAIRECLYRFTTWDSLTNIDLASLDCLDLGNLPVESDVTKGQTQLGSVLGELLKDQGVPIVLGGGHETAFGHYLGYAAANLPCGIINFDAHLDVRPFPKGPHSGSSFRQAMEYAPFPLKPGRYVVIGAQRQSVAKAHAHWVQKQQGRIYWLEEVSSRQKAMQVFEEELKRLGNECARIMVTVDADVFRQADVPGTSAPSPMGLEGSLFSEIALFAGSRSQVGSMDIVEINPQYDRDNQSACWAAMGIRQFLIGLAIRFGKMAGKKEY